jgi:hypothetical protein
LGTAANASLPPFLASHTTHPHFPPDTDLKSAIQGNILVDVQQRYIMYQLLEVRGRTPHGVSKDQKSAP